jgi:hypothetical protein
MMKKLIISFLAGAGGLALIAFGLWFIVYWFKSVLAIVFCLLPPLPWEAETCETSTIQYVAAIAPLLLGAWVFAYVGLYVEPAEEKSDDR